MITVDKNKICPKCNRQLSDLNGVHYCETPNCDVCFMLKSTRVQAQKTIERVRSKHQKYLSGNHKIPAILNDPYYEEFLQAYSAFDMMAKYMERDIEESRHSTDLLIARRYLELFQAADLFEKKLDNWIESQEGNYEETT